MIVGILKEPPFEKRIAMLPTTIGGLKKFNTEIFVEKDAGIGALIPDNDFVSVGAIVSERKEILRKSDILLTINPIEESEIGFLRSEQIVISMFNPFQNKSLLQKLVDMKVTAFSYEMIPRTTRGQAMDVLSSMATISGYRAVLDAALHLPKFFPMFMSAAGTIKPAKVLILGAGVAGLQAIASARKLGAIVEVFDVRSAVKEEVQSLGGKFIEVEGAREDKSAGGYAIEQTEEFRNKQKQLIHDHAVKSNVIITTAQIPGKNAPVLITKETVDALMPGTVIVDLAASTGGNCELTQNAKIISYKGVSIIGKSDYPSDMAYDASNMFGNNVFNFLKLLISPEGQLTLNFNDEIVKGTCITYNGEIVNDRLK